MSQVTSRSVSFCSTPLDGNYPRRLDSLTSARFLAAAFVFLHHSIGPDNIPIIDLGYVGVTFFFVLSGFVLTWAGSAERGAITSYRNRFARVYPLHLLTLILAVGLPGAFAVGSKAAFLQNLLLVQSWSPAASSSFNWVSWSISDEAFFYLLFPLTWWFLRRIRPGVVLWVGVAAWITQGAVGLTIDILVTNQDVAAFVTYKFPPFRFLEFVIGACLALTLRSGIRIPKLLTRALLVVSVAGAVSALVLDLGEGASRALIISLTLPLVVLILVRLVRSERKGGVLWMRSSWMIRLGELSFAFYMTHALVIRLISAWIGLPSPGYMPLWSVALAFATSMVLAWAAFNYVERPLERLLRARRVPVRAGRTALETANSASR